MVGDVTITGPFGKLIINNGVEVHYNSSNYEIRVNTGGTLEASGAKFIEGGEAIMSYGTIDINNCQFENNYIRVNNDNIQSIRNSKFTGVNGSVYANNSPNVQIKDNTFAGYVNLDNCQDAIVDNNTFTGAQSSVYISGNTSPTITNNTFTQSTYPIRFYGLPTPTISGNNFVANSKLYLNKIVIDERTELKKIEGLNFILQSLLIKENGSLTIPPSSICYFSNSNQLTVQENGNLSAKGVKFKSTSNTLNAINVYGNINIDNSTFEKIRITFNDHGTGKINNSNFIIPGNYEGISNHSFNYINAENNYWNGSLGPYHSSNPNGNGCKVSDGVDFKPFMTQEIPPTYALLKGKVLDVVTKEPISGAKVSVEPLSYGGIVKTDQNGEWVLGVVEGEGYKLKIVKYNYEILTKENISVVANSYNTFTNELTPTKWQFDNYRIVPYSAYLNPNIIEVNERGFGYAWYIVEGYYAEDNNWYPVQDAEIKGNYSNGFLINSNSDIFNYEYTSEERSLEKDGLFSVKIEANKIGGVGDQAEIYLTEVNGVKLSANDAITIKTKVIPLKYSTGWGYNLYGKAGIGVGSGGFLSASGFGGGGSGAYIEYLYEGFGENAKVTGTRIYRKNDLFLGGEVKLGPPNLIKIPSSDFGIDLGAKIEGKVTWPYEREYEFDLEDLSGLDPLSVYYLINEPIAIYGKGILSLTQNIILGMAECLFDNNAQQIITENRKSDANGFEVTGSVSAGINFGLGNDLLSSTLNIGPLFEMSGKVGTKTIKNKDNSIIQQLYANSKLDMNFGRKLFDQNNPITNYLFPQRLLNLVALPNDLEMGFKFENYIDNSKFWHSSRLNISIMSDNKLNSYHLRGSKQNYNTYFEFTDAQVRNIINSTSKIMPTLGKLGFESTSFGLFNTAGNPITFETDLLNFLSKEKNAEEEGKALKLKYGNEGEAIDGIDIGLDLTLPTAAVIGFDIIIGGGIQGSRVTKFDLNSGEWVDGKPLLNKEIGEVPFHNITFQEITAKIWDKITNPDGEVWPILKNYIFPFLQIVDLIIPTDNLNKSNTVVNDYEFSLNGKGSKLILKENAIPSGIENTKCINWEWKGNNGSNLNKVTKNSFNEYALKVRKIREEISGLHYGIGGFYQLKPVGMKLLDSAKIIIKYSDEEITGIDETKLAVYYEDSSGVWNIIPSIVDTDSNIVYANIDAFRTYTLAPSLPSGAYSFSISPNNIKADGQSIGTITSDQIRNNDGSLVEDGSVFTIKVDRGTIISEDIDSGTEGVQISSQNGILKFDYLVDSIAVPVNIFAKSVNGFAVISGTFQFKDEQLPSPPRLISIKQIDDKIKLNWLPVEENDVIGYKIYFDNDQSGPPYHGKANIWGTSSPLTIGLDTAAIISGLEKDTAYFISVTSYDLLGNESSYSNEISMTLTGVSLKDTLKIPKNYSISQNYPNPFNPTSKIRFSIPQNGNVKIDVFDILGRKVITLLNEYKKSGTYEVEFNAKNYSSGIYFYRIQAGDFVKTKKMILLK